MNHLSFVPFVDANPVPVKGNAIHWLLSEIGKKQIEETARILQKFPGPAIDFGFLAAPRNHQQVARDMVEKFVIGGPHSEPGYMTFPLSESEGLGVNAAVNSRAQCLDDIAPDSELGQYFKQYGKSRLLFISMVTQSQHAVVIGYPILLRAIALEAAIYKGCNNSVCDRVARLILADGELFQLDLVGKRIVTISDFQSVWLAQS